MVITRNDGLLRVETKLEMQDGDSNILITQYLYGIRSKRMLRSEKVVLNKTEINEAVRIMKLHNQTPTPYSG